MDKFFKKPEDLNTDNNNIDSNLKNSFYKAGDLSDSPKVEEAKDENLMNKYFTSAGDLEVDKSTTSRGTTQIDGSDYFRKANDKDLSNNHSNEVENEFGSMIVSQEKLDEMINEGYNITKVEKIGNFYSIEFTYENSQGRSR